jgi:carboxyl-terminal processing protease
MLRFLPLTLFAAAIVLAACSPSAPAPAAKATLGVSTERDNLDGVVVQTGGDNGEAAKAAAKAEKVANLKKLLERLGKAENLNDSFTISEEIEDLGKDVKDELIAGLKDMAPIPRIAGLRALYTCTGYDESVSGLLALVIAEGDNSMRVAAAEVLGTVASERHAKLLTEAINKQVFEPEVRVQLALALWNSARDIEAKKVLRGMLTADNESFRIAAALALGETQDFTDAKPILEILAEEPTVRGRVARRMLEWEKEIKRLEAVLQDNIPGEKKPEKIDTRLLDTVQGMIQERYIYPDNVSGRKLLYAAASGMLDGFDPYTCLLEDNQLRDAAEIRRFAVPTLGITLGKVRIRATRRERVTVVLAVVPGSPADKAGIRPLDRIFRVLKDITPERVNQLRVSDRDLPFDEHALQTLPLDEAITRFKGAVGQTCALQFRRDKWLLSRWVHMVHEAPVEEPVLFETLPGGFGMIHVHDLSATAPAKIGEALAAFKTAGVKGIMLDLRGAAGGSVEAATQIAGYFLKKGSLVTYSIGRSEQLAPKTDYKTAGETPDVATPVVVITDSGTADAAEVLAAALKEHGRAKTVGQKTFGRALVQELIPLNAAEPDSDKRKLGLLLTVARYYTPVA